MTPHHAWLFVREDASVWLEWTSEADFVLKMYGPSVHRRSYAFESREDLYRFLETAEQRLLSTGWSRLDLAQGEDRRQAAHPVSIERRRAKGEVV